MLEKLPNSILNLIKSIQILPGVWEKTASKMAFFLIKKEQNILDDFWKNISSIKKELKSCENCFNFMDKTSEKFCKICEDFKRNKNIICVVENPIDIISIENTQFFQWKYHVLHWVLSPLEGILPEKLKIKELLNKIDKETEEIILAINPTLEWEATNNYISTKINDLWFENIKITVLARGISMWWDLEYTDEITIKKALENRIYF